MKGFPNILHSKNKTEFKSLKYNRNLCYLRRDIYEHIINRKTETEYFDIESFNTNRVNDIEIVNKMISQVSQELHKLDWNTALSFGGTGLFIYSTDKPPANCWQDGL
jgi:hypothetical protein